MSRGSIRFLTLTLILVLFVAVLPTGQAAFRSYGTLVGETTTDADAAGFLRLTLGAATLVYNDVDNSGTPNFVSSSTHDDFYVSITAGATVAANDIRLARTASGNLAAGVQVKAGDADRGNAVAALAGSWAFIDKWASGASRANVFNIGDGLFLDVDGSGTVTQGDIQVMRESASATTTATSSWTFITASTANGTALVALPAFSYMAYDTNANGIYDREDAVVLDVGSDGYIGPSDVWLTKPGTTAGASRPKIGETHVFHNLRAAAGAAFAFDDIDTDGTVDDIDAIYIDVDGSGAVSVGDILIGPVTATASTSTNAGLQIGTGHAALGTALTNVGTIRYVDNNGNNVIDTTDDVYLDIGGASTTLVEAGDLRLAKGGTSSGGTVGSRVKSTESDLNRQLKTPGVGTMRFLDFDGGGVYGPDDVIYYDADADTAITPGDIRFSKGPSPVSTFGAFMKQTNSDTEPCFRFTFAAADIGWVDESSPGTAGITEVVYLDRSGTGTVSPYDIRLSGGSGTFAAGTFVLSGNNDQANTLTSAGGLPFAYYDANTDGAFSLGTGTATDDPVYLDMDASSSVTVGDVRITKASTGSFQPGTKVQSGNADNNLPLTALPATATVRGFDVDGNGIFDDKDALYLNVDDASEPASPGNGCASAGDLRLSGSGGTTGTGSTGGPTGPTNSPPVARIVCTTTVGSSEFSFSGTTSSDADGSISSYSWSFGDGTSSTSSTVTKEYTTDGTFTVTLTVTDNGGTARSTTLRLVVPAVNSNCAAPTTQSPEPTETETPTQSPTGSPTGSPTETPSNTTDRNDEPDDEGTPGPGAVLSVFVVLTMLGLLRRRR